MRFGISKYKWEKWRKQWTTIYAKRRKRIWNMQRIIAATKCKIVESRLAFCSLAISLTCAHRFTHDQSHQRGNWQISGQIRMTKRKSINIYWDLTVSIKRHAKSFVSFHCNIWNILKATNRPLWVDSLWWHREQWLGVKEIASPIFDSFSFFVCSDIVVSSCTSQATKSIIFMQSMCGSVWYADETKILIGWNVIIFTFARRRKITTLAYVFRSHRLIGSAYVQYGNVNDDSIRNDNNNKLLVRQNGLEKTNHK